MSEKPVDKRQESEQNLQSGWSRAKYLAETIWRVVPSAIFTVDNNRIITGWNNKAEEVAGYSAAEVIGKECSFFALEPCIERCGVFSGEVEKPIIARECHIRTRDGEKKTISKNADLLLDSDGEIIGAVESFEDITERKEVENQLLAERDKFISMLLALNQGMHILNRDFIIEYQNEVLKENFGDCEGKTCYAVFRGKRSPCNPCLMHEAIQSGQIQHVEYETLAGRCYEQIYTRVTDVDGKDKVVALLRDITEKKASLAAAMHAEQLAAVGELAAGVAHEINNPINGIINYAQIIRNKSEKEGLVSDIAERVIKESNRIARIVEGLLSFSRSRHEEKMIVSVKDILSDSLTLTAAQMRKDNIAVKIDFKENLPQIMAQAHEIEQVFINVISNSRYALNQKYPEPHDDKLLEISAAPVKKNDRNYVRVSFLDHGTGISANIIDKVRNPFFTTKTEGNRTGLGLSISHGILENHEGKLDIDSLEGQFTRINVDLPVWRENGKPRNEA